MKTLWIGLVEVLTEPSAGGGNTSFYQCRYVGGDCLGIRQHSFRSF